MSNLRIYTDALSLVVHCRPHWEKLARLGQRDLSKQLQRCAPSVPQNVAEGEGRFDGHGRQRFETAIGSARETIACLEIGVAIGFLEASQVADAGAAYTSRRGKAAEHQQKMQQAGSPYFSKPGNQAGSPYPPGRA